MAERPAPPNPTGVTYSNTRPKKGRVGRADRNRRGLDDSRTVTPFAEGGACSKTHNLIKQGFKEG